MVDTASHQLMLKNGKWDGSSLGNLNEFEALVGQPLLVSCTSRNANPSPNLTLYLNNRPWEETSATSRVEEIQMGVPSGSKVIEGRMDMVYENMFQNGALLIECKASFEAMEFDSKLLKLGRGQMQVVSDQR